MSILPLVEGILILDIVSLTLSEIVIFVSNILPFIDFFLLGSSVAGANLLSRTGGLLLVGTC